MEKEKAPMVVNSDAPIVQPIPLASNPQVRRTLKHLIILLALCFSLLLITVIDCLVKGEVNDNSTISSERIITVFIGIFCLTVFCGLSILAVHRYSALGLRICGCVHVIGLVVFGFAVGIVILLALVDFGRTAPSDGIRNKAFMVRVISFLFLFTADRSIILVLIVIFCFKLARLIDENRHVITQQI